VRDYQIAADKLLNAPERFRRFSLENCLRTRAVRR